jgi:hypothetical protein
MSGAAVRIEIGVARIRGTGRDDRPAFATPAPRARAVSARALEPWCLVRVHLANRSRGPAPLGQGAPHAREEARRHGRLPRDRLGDPRHRRARASNRRCRARAAADRGSRRGGEEARAAARRGGGRRGHPRCVAGEHRARPRRVGRRPQRGSDRTARSRPRAVAGLAERPTGRVRDARAGLRRHLALGQGRRGVRAQPPAISASP